MQLENNDIAELLYILRTNNIAIYGAGYVASRFYQALKEHGLSSRGTFVCDNFKY